jgi:predicted dehydrogenase
MKIGIAGIGFMGMIHYLACRRVEGAEVTAISSRDAKKLAGDWRGIKGNFGPEGTQMDLAGVAAHAQFEDLLADPNVEVVDICLPPAMHVEATLQALAAGKHVFCEKPLALSAADCERMVAAAAEAGRLLLAGHVLPFVPEYAFAFRAVRDGTYGRPLGGIFKRIISDPEWLPDFYNPNTVGGPLLDLHVHDAHFIRLAFGMPAAVTSQGRMRGEVVEFCNTQFQFADERLVVSAASGVINQQGRPFTHGYEMHFEQATLLYDLAGVEEAGTPLTVLAADGSIERPELGDGDPVLAFEAELAEVVRSIDSGEPSPILGGQLARDAVILCHKQTESVQTGQTTPV